MGAYQSSVCIRTRRYKMNFKKLLWVLAGVVIAALLFFFFMVPGMVDKKYNGRIANTAFGVSDSVLAFHNSLRIADMHDDILLWGRDILQENDYGHTDVPRLIKANVGLQVFSVVTKTPRNMNYTHNTAEMDNITPLMIAQLAPVSTWFSLTDRALYRARQLREYSRQSNGRLVLVRSRNQLKTFLKRRKANRRLLAGLLAIEGMHALNGKLENLQKLYDAGYRMIGLAHFFDNAFSGSAHGTERYGLTKLGRAAVREMGKRHILIDLAHASPQAIDDVLSMVTRPVVVSHTGVQAGCKGVRNLTDDQIIRIAATGGVIGIGYWKGAVCGTDVAHIVAGIRHTVDVAGIDHVALGSDWDGATTVQLDADHLPLLTAGLLKAGFSKTDIAKIMGENFITLLIKSLPG